MKKLTLYTLAILLALTVVAVPASADNHRSNHSNRSHNSNRSGSHYSGRSGGHYRSGSHYGYRGGYGGRLILNFPRVYVPDYYYRTPPYVAYPPYNPYYGAVYQNPYDRRSEERPESVPQAQWVELTETCNIKEGGTRECKTIRRPITEEERAKFVERDKTEICTTKNGRPEECSTVFELSAKPEPMQSPEPERRPEVREQREERAPETRTYSLKPSVKTPNTWQGLHEVNGIVYNYDPRPLIVCVDGKVKGTVKPGGELTLSRLPAGKVFYGH